MTDCPIVSIIMPTFNAELTISQSIESVLEQEYSFWELIIINDGSTDSTLNSIENHLLDQRVHLINQTNKGVAEARNKGLLIAKGKYIAFLDADDCWRKDKLIKQVYYLDSNKNIGLVYCTHKCFFKNVEDSFYCSPKEPVKFSDDYYRLLTHDYIPTLTVMIRSCVIAKIGFFDKTLYSTEDWDLWIRIAKKFNIGIIQETLAYYRINDQGISKNNIRQIENEMKVLKKHVLFNDEIPDRVKRSAQWVFNKRKTNRLLKTTSFSNSILSCARTIKYYPMKIDNMKLIIKVLINPIIYSGKSLFFSKPTKLS